MKRIRMPSLLLALLAVTGSPGMAQRRAYAPYAGRWDLTITARGETYPSWMEVSDRGGEVTVIVVGRAGTLHGSDNIGLEAVPVTTSPGLNTSAVQLGDQTVASQLAFTTLESFGKSEKIPVRWSIESAGNKITGTQARGDGVEGKISGERAPALKRKNPQKWTDPEPLFSGSEMTSSRKFDDFKLHVEFNCPQGGAGGILLRGRYELVVAYPAVVSAERTSGIGALYGFLAPEAAVAATPGAWESFDVTLVGRTVTVLRNNVVIIDNKQIPGITGGALDSHEAEPGPIYLQSAGADGMQYRNVTISVPAR